MDKVVHFEIPADDVERARKFYATIFEWNVISIPYMGYTIVQTGPTDDKGMTKENGFINGGMLKRQEPIESLVITIHVKSIEEAVKRIEANGGKVIREKVKVGDIGYAAYFKDTEGNVLGLWQGLR